MDAVDFDEESLKDLDSDQEDPDFQNFLNEIIEGKQIVKSKKPRKKHKENSNQKAQTLMQQANQYYFEKKNEDAMACAREAIIADPDSSAPFHLMRKVLKLILHLDLIYEEIGDKEKMLNWLGLAASLESNTEIWLKWVHLALSMGKISTSLWCYNRAIKCDRQSVQIRIDKAKLLIDLNENRKALNWLSKSLEVNVSSHKRIEILYLMVFPNYKLGNYDEAIRLLKEILMTKSDLEYVNGLGELL